MSLWAYNLLMRALQPWVRRKLARRAQSEPQYAEHVEQRFGRYAEPAKPVDLWIHAVSLGESRAAQILLSAMRLQRPGLRVLLTHGTATGWEQGQQMLQPGDLQAWLPWDTTEAVCGFLDHFQPRMGVLMETEVWPNLVHACRSRGIELVLANARLSEKSLRSALHLSWWALPAYQALTMVWPQTDADARRFTRLGVKFMLTLGNLKYDQQPDVALLAQGQALKEHLPKPVLMLASSRQGEEAAWAQALRGQTDLCLPWVVPRHPQRFDEVADVLRTHGFKVLRRSQMSFDEADLTQCAQANTVVLGDSLGEMAFYYGVAQVALMGGSFERFGGQNLIEALACGCPVVLGPHTYNFEQASAQAAEVGAALSAADMAQGVQKGLELCRSPDWRLAMSQHGLNMLKGHQGVAARMAKQVLARLERLTLKGH